MIRHKKSKYYVEIFNPKHIWKYLGRIITLKDDTRVFCTHLKQPYKHFYIKGLGYPINHELLGELYSIKIDYILIPEKGLHRFKCYLANTNEYLKGTLISEPFTEPQNVIPLTELKEVSIPKEKLTGALYES